MSEYILGLSKVLDDYDAFIFDQWGVMHQGSSGYPGVAETMARLRQAGKKIAVLSNSGRKAEYNAKRLERLGFGPETHDILLTSGQALWQDLASGALECPKGGYWVISQDQATTDDFVTGLDPGCIAPSLDHANGVILLALPEGTVPDAHMGFLEEMAQKKMPLVCGNPDKHAPTERGLNPSPGYVTEMYEKMGGMVTYYGKPHKKVFEMVIEELGGISRQRTLMIGDNIATDVAGANSVGLETMLITKGVHAEDFGNQGVEQVVLKLAERHGVEAPRYVADAAVMD